MKVLAKGVYFNKPHKKAPHYVIGHIMLTEQVIDLFKTYSFEGKLDLQIKLSDKGVHYVVINESFFDKHTPELCKERDEIEVDKEIIH